MATKPTSLPRWAEETGGTQHNISVPSSGKQDVGWLTGEKPPSQWFNFLFNLLYQWARYLRDAVFVGEAGEPGITVTAGAGNENGIEAMPTGTGAAVLGTATTDAGSTGLKGVGAGDNPGAKFVASGTGPGAACASSVAGAGLDSTTSGAGPAVLANASGGSGYGVDTRGNATRASLHMTPQSFSPGSGPSSPAAGNVIFNSQDNNLYTYRGSAWTMPGVYLPLVSKTADYTAALNDHTILVDATGAAVTITLPAAATATGQVLMIKKTDGSANAVTIDGNASENIDGGTTFTLPASNNAVVIQCSGGAWFVLAEYV